MTVYTDSADLSGTFYTCVSIFAALVGLGIAVSGLIEWRNARTGGAYRSIRYVEAISRATSGLFIAITAIAVIALDGSLGDISSQQPTADRYVAFSTSETVVYVLFAAAILSGLISLGFTLWRHTRMLRDLIRERMGEAR